MSYPLKKSSAPLQQSPWETLSRLGTRLPSSVADWVQKYLNEDLTSKVHAVTTYRNEIGLDAFGFDPETARVGLALAALLHRKYFRTEVFDIENLPKGRVIVVANHGGQLPLDAIVLNASLVMDASPPRLPRGMVEKWTANLPFISYWYPRLGQVVGTPENARRLLQQDDCCLVVFPEGVSGIAKPYWRRYELQEFGAGFARLALDTNTTVVPAAIIGPDEQYVSLGSFKPFSRLLKMPAFPLLPQLLVGMPFPLPVRYRIHFGKPLHFNPDASVEGCVMATREAISKLLKRGLRARKSIFR